MLSSPSIPTGKLFTSNIGGLRNLHVEAELWQITRAGITIPNATLVRNLSPSQELFNCFANKWRYLPPQSWWNNYEKKFLEELNSDEKLILLREIYKKLMEGKNIVLICFCKNNKYCHRRLVGEFFKPFGIAPIELNPIQEEQLSLILE